MLNLTNKQLIEILSKRDPNALAEIKADFNYDGFGFDFPELCEVSDVYTVHYSEERDLIVASGGYT